MISKFVKQEIIFNWLHYFVYFKILSVQYCHIRAFNFLIIQDGKTPLDLANGEAARLLTDESRFN